MDIFELQHVKGVHPSDRNALATIAVKNGIFESENAALKWFQTDECSDQVIKGYMNAQRLGITGVPFFVFQGRWAASGAMGVDSFVDLLSDITHREQRDGSVEVTSVSGEQCV